MAKIKGIEGMTDEQIMFEVQTGAKFVICGNIPCVLQDQKRKRQNKRTSPLHKTN